MYIPVNQSFLYIKGGFKGVNIIQACFRDDVKLVSDSSEV